MPRLPDPARSQAVLVGVADYASADLEDIPAARNNLSDLHELLTEGRPAPFSPEPGRVTVIPDPATPRDLGAPLLTAARRAEDVFLVYYAGHGLIGDERRELYLALADSDRDVPSFTAFPFEGIREAFHASPARNRVLILDCCFSGRAISGGLTGVPEPVVERLEIAGTYTLTSAPPNDMARFVKGRRHTEFTGQLLLALRDGIPEAHGEDVTLGALYRHLKRTLRAKGLPEPQQCGTDTAEFLVLSRPRGRAGGRPVLAPGGHVGGVGRVGRVERVEHEELIRRRNAGHRLGETGHTAEAVRELTAIVPDLTRTFGADDPATLVGRVSLAHWTGLAGDPDQALTLAAVAVDDLTRVLGPDDPATLAGRAQQAYWTGETGRPREALGLTTTLLTDLVRVLGPDDRETLVNRARLTRWTGESGDPMAAARRAAELVPDLARTLGDQDRETLVTRINHAHWTGRSERAGGPREATRLLTRVVPDLTWSLGGDDRHTLVGRARLGQWTGASGRRRRALRLYAAVVPDLTRTLGNDDPETLLARGQLAHWTGETGRPAEAAQQLALLIPDLEWVLGPNAPATLACRARAAHWTGAEGDVGQAVRMLSGTLPELRRVLGPDHAETRAAASLLGAWRGRADRDRRLRAEIFYGRRPTGRG
ncbi:caspase, EACC1-associated type [Streptomyces sp. 6N223]|uniref:caspase, EACC1-associated type n=1 Tax=Streptomyces sp. 6N223 TaxID=3457412 RepID=UPI003FD5185F